MLTNRFPIGSERHLVRIKMNTSVICEGPILGSEIGGDSHVRHMHAISHMNPPEFPPEINDHVIEYRFGSIFKLFEIHFWSTSNK